MKEKTVEEKDVKSLGTGKRSASVVHRLWCDKIQAVRDQLTKSACWGDLQSERFLLSQGDLVGQSFCFEKADIHWQFDANELEVWIDGHLDSKIPLFPLETVSKGILPGAEPSDQQREHRRPKAA